MTKQRNARFWVFENLGWVKLTLRPGQSLSWGYAHRTDEGWTSYGATWTHCGDWVERECGDDGVDCDGRLSHSYHHECALADLHSQKPYCPEGEQPQPFMVPTWSKVSSSQRDYSAEAMGY